MKANIIRLQSSLMLLIVIVGTLLGVQAGAQSSTLDFEKVTLVSKLAKHVSWPNSDEQSKFVIGVYKDAEKYEYFSDFFANKAVNNEDIVVRLVNEVSETKDMNILYVSSLTSRRNIITLAKKTSGSHILLITENNKITSDVMVNISYDQKKLAMSFDVYYAAFDDEKLKMPDLSYFQDEKNNEEILTVSPTFAIEQQEDKKLSEAELLNKKIKQQQSSLEQLNKKLKQSEESSDSYKFVLEKNAERLKVAQQKNTENNKEIKSKDKKLQSLEKQLKTQNTQLQTQKTQLQMNKDEWQLADQNKAEEQEKTLIDLTEKLKKQKQVTSSTSKKLTDQIKSNEALSKFEMLFYVFLLIAIIALIIVLVMWNKVKKSASQVILPPISEVEPLLPIREEQLIKSENMAAFGYIASDITYAVGLSLDEFLTQAGSGKDEEKTITLKPVITLLENFNLIAADQDETQVQRFDLIAYAQKMMMLYDFEFKQSDVLYSYSGEEELILNSVPSYIALVLLHLINNSLKHGFDNNGKGKVSLKIEKGTKSGVQITYADDGKGMNKETLKQVFTPFFTTHNDRGYVGIGMSTTYDLIKNKLGGEIKIESQVSKGTTVIINLS
ncbi:YfiR/HmsC family protein [Pseudocolwellia sp. HL-MZ7]|uniref:YfiR/HmsC family protein n=1 Tax=Pseudocolwellia sp. HL-MZ7 TaxID=3400627 RepID=UPI003CFA5B9D